MTLKIEEQIKELETLIKETSPNSLNPEPLFDKKILKEEEIKELLDVALIDLTINFCISKLQGEVTNDLLYKAGSLKELLKKYEEK